MSVVQNRPLLPPLGWRPLPFAPRFAAKAEKPAPRLSERYSQAMVYAARLHATQVRKASDTPYISHLQAVAGLVLENGGTEDEAIAAWLHDAVEDQGGYKVLKDIRKRFGDPVADIVAGCSDCFTQPAPPLYRRILEWQQQHLREQGLWKTLQATIQRIRQGFVTLFRDHKNPFAPQRPPWIERKMAYLQHMKTVPESVLLVSSADKLHNARTLVQDYRQRGEALWTEFSGSKEGTLWYFDSLIEAYGQRQHVTPITEELARTIDELKQLVGATASVATPPDVPILRLDQNA